MDTLIPETTIAGVTVVDTPVVRAAQKYARAHLNEMGFNHVMRSWIFGVVVYKKLQEVGAVLEIDLEVHALSAILHDLGWDVTGELISKDKRFEVDGAEAACGWIKEEQKNGRAEHWDDYRLRLLHHSAYLLSIIQSAYLVAIVQGMPAIRSYIPAIV